MKPERRNYYRVLYVQPEAPAELIEAAYRCLMFKLRRHPDLGGDHDEAVAINQAYETLIDPERRKAYDDYWRRRRQPRVEAADPAAVAQSATAEAVRREAPLDLCCAFCRAALPQLITPESRCSHCESPLAPVRPPEGPPPPDGQRGAARVDKSTIAALHPRFGRPASRARLRDVSATGISLFTAVKVEAGDVVRVVTNDIDVVARVVRVRQRDPVYIVHARLLTVWVRQPAGTLLSVMA